MVLMGVGCDTETFVLLRVVYELEVCESRNLELHAES